MLATTGVTRLHQVLNINLGYAAVSVIACHVGVPLTDKIGRRYVTVWAPIGCAMCFAAITAGAGVCG